MAAHKIEEILRNKKIYQILRPKTVTCRPWITLQKALELMHQENAGYIVVTDEHLKVVGMFTEKHVLMKVLVPGVSLNEPMNKYMNAEPITLTKRDTVGRAIEVMHDTKMRHIPLVDDLGQCVGVLSVRTVVTFLSELFPTEVFNLPPHADQFFDTAEGG